MAVGTWLLSSWPPVPPKFGSNFESHDYLGVKRARLPDTCCNSTSRGCFRLVAVVATFKLVAEPRPGPPYRAASEQLVVVRALHMVH